MVQTSRSCDSCQNMLEGTWAQLSAAVQQQRSRLDMVHCLPSRTPEHTVHRQRSRIEHAATCHMLLMHPDKLSSEQRNPLMSVPHFTRLTC
jgi:hypothetical protein